MRMKVKFFFPLPWCSDDEKTWISCVLTTFCLDINWCTLISIKFRYTRCFNNIELHASVSSPHITNNHRQQQLAAAVIYPHFLPINRNLYIFLVLRNINEKIRSVLSFRWAPCFFYLPSLRVADLTNKRFLRRHTQGEQVFALNQLSNVGNESCVRLVFWYVSTLPSTLHSILGTFHLSGAFIIQYY